MVLEKLGAQQGVQTDGGFLETVRKAGEALKKKTGHTTPNYDSIYGKIESWVPLDVNKRDEFDELRKNGKNTMDAVLKAFGEIVDFVNEYKKNNPDDKKIPSISL